MWDKIVQDIDFSLVAIGIFFLLLIVVMFGGMCTVEQNKINACKEIAQTVEEYKVCRD